MHVEQEVRNVDECDEHHDPCRYEQSPVSAAEAWISGRGANGRRKGRTWTDTTRYRSLPTMAPAGTPTRGTRSTLHDCLCTRRTLATRLSELDPSVLEAGTGREARRRSGRQEARIGEERWRPEFLLETKERECRVRREKGQENWVARETEGQVEGGRCKDGWLGQLLGR